MKNTIPLLLIILAPVVLLAGAGSATPGLDPSGFTLFDNTGSKWFVPTISHRVYLGYTTGSTGSWSTGAYMGTLSFDLTSRLSADVSIGMAEHIYFSRGFDRREYMADVLLDWRPTDNFRLQLNVGGLVPEEALGGTR